MMVTKVEKSSEDDLWLNPKDLRNKWVFSSHSPKELSMVKVQRSSLGKGVEPQANGGRKIGLL